MATTRPETVAHFRLWDLPQELQDLIFDFAYSTDANILDLYPDFQRRSSQFQPKISQFLVSKRFFLAAAASCIGHRRLDEASTWNLQECGTHMFRQFATRVTVCSRRVSELEHCVSLRSVVINTDSVWKDCWNEENDYSGAHAAATNFFHALGKIRGLHDILLTTPPRPTHLAPEEIYRLTETYKIREKHVKPLLTLPRPPERRLREKVLGHTPLYFGSRVCLDTNELLPPNYAASLPRYLEDGMTDEDLAVLPPPQIVGKGREVMDWTDFRLEDVCACAWHVRKSLG